MQFLANLLGTSGGAVVTTVFALGIVIVLILSALWVLKRTMQGPGFVPHVRGRRLQVVEHMQLDPRRRLILIRRDDVEHLLVIGGPQDLVVEAGFKADAVASRRASETQPTVTPTPVAANMQGPLPAVRPHIEKLREFARPATIPTAPPPRRSLRHTGLLRPVSVGEPAVIPMPPIAGDNANRPRPDSATRPQGTDDNGRTGLAGSRDFSTERTADTP